MHASRTLAFSLVVCCPVFQANPEHCILCGIRELPMRERVNWLNSLDKDELVSLVATHHQCESECSQPKRNPLLAS